MRSYTLTEDEVRRVVFAASVAYATALRMGKRLDEAEWDRKAAMYQELDKLERRSIWDAL